MEYFTEASAKTGHMVDEIFRKAACQLYKECYLKGKSKIKKLKMGEGGDLELDKVNKKKKKGCCWKYLKKIYN